MKRRLLFRRDFRGYYGGHGKVWDYYRHVLAHPEWEPNIHFTDESVLAGNPWREESVEGIVPEWVPDRYDALFLAGMDWASWPHDRGDMPVINLIQHVRHAIRGTDVNAFLQRRAIRLCVSSAVAQELMASGARGPIQVIDAALDLPGAPTEKDTPRAGIVIGAIKQPALGAELAAELRKGGLRVSLLHELLPRRQYLAAIGGAEVAVLLPNVSEGFYLPALEAMALGCATVVPDCLGNRAYAVHEQNALVPDYTMEGLSAAVRQLVGDGAQLARLRDGGTRTAARFSQERERRSFHAVLDDLPALWAAA